MTFGHSKLEGITVWPLGTLSLKVRTPTSYFKQVLKPL